MTMRSANQIAIGCLLLLVVSAANGQTVSQQSLWEEVPPGSEKHEGVERYEGRGSGRPNRWLVGVSRPVLSLYRPANASQQCAAVVVCPGGGYSGQAIDKEGHYVARWLAERGMFAAVLPYRCGGGVHQQPVPWLDASRAIQTVRANAAEWGVDSARVGVMGFSAGGHLAASAATKWVDPEPDNTDVVKRVSSRPDFAVLVYPVISMRDGVTHGGSRRNLLGDDPSDELIAEWSADEQVTEQTPPALIIHSADDRAVPIDNAMRFFDACRKHGVEAELHVFPTGGHGYGMWATQGTIATWPRVFERWLDAHELLD